MMTVIKKMRRDVSAKAIEVAGDFSLRTRKFCGIFALLLCLVAVGSYITFMVGTTVAAAERKESLSAVVSLTADIAKKEAVYVSLLKEVNREKAEELGFGPIEPSFVVRNSFTRGFSLSN